MKKEKVASMAWVHLSTAQGDIKLHYYIRTMFERPFDGTSSGKVADRDWVTIVTGSRGCEGNGPPGEVADRRPLVV